MVNQLEVINVCKICGRCFDKDGYELENENGYEVDLFVCDKCKKDK